jgi:hypothetical protein
MNGMEEQSLPTHLQGIHKALRSLAQHMAAEKGTKMVRSQLEWAASHLHAAIRELRGEVEHPEAASEAAPSTDAPRSGLMDGLRGHTQAITIPEILGFIASLRKSGVLRVRTRDEAFLIQLEQGSVVYAQGDNPPHGQLLGEILVAQGALKQPDLDRVLQSGASAPGKFGQALIEQGLVSKEALCIALGFQVQYLFHRIFDEQDALFQFDEGMQLMAPEDIRLNVTSLLLESARSTDEELHGDEPLPERRSA